MTNADKFARIRELARDAAGLADHLSERCEDDIPLDSLDNPALHNLALFLSVAHAEAEALRNELRTK